MRTSLSFLSCGGLALVAATSLLLSAAKTWDQPFQHEWLGRNGARYAIAARNLLRHSWAETGGVPCLQVGSLDEEGPLPYARHPPGLSWLIALAFLTFGESENTARLVPLIATVLAAGCVGLLAGRRGSVPAAAGAAAAFCLLPMTLLYGGHVDVQGSPTTLFILLGVLFWTIAEENGRGRLRWAAGSRARRTASRCPWSLPAAAKCRRRRQGRRVLPDGDAGLRDRPGSALDVRNHRVSVRPRR